MQNIKKNSYDKWWLRKDMENMGYIFEYCHKYCMEIYIINIDRAKFLNAFMVSNFRHEMEIGHPRLLSQSAYDSVKMFIDIDNGGNLSCFEKIYNKEKSYYYKQLYWVGWMYAYHASIKKLFNNS